ncbi:HalOD1 output domain-containing protein [Natrinema sp. 74]|uniref:HalOD1 output domain-containing protein n=1 Tax=Natrinema sp. 74 TaxID=3384159 RepID=UPI0038D3B112
MSEHTHRPADGPTFDARTGTYEQHYDAADGADIVVSAIRSVADIAGVPTTEMEPVGDSIDADVLVDAVEAATATDDATVGVTVSIHEHDVTIGGGRIVIDPPSEFRPRAGS